MAGVNILVVYADGPSNVTVSPRHGQGHMEPNFDPATRIMVLEGIGVMPDGSIVANARCDSSLV